MDAHEFFRAYQPASHAHYQDGLMARACLAGMAGEQDLPAFASLEDDDADQLTLGQRDAIGRVSEMLVAGGPDLLIADALARATGERRVEGILLLAACITVLTDAGIEFGWASEMVERAAATLVEEAYELLDEASIRG